MWLGVNDDVDAPDKREIRVNDVGPLDDDVALRNCREIC
jgi:hypothetical protein